MQKSEWGFELVMLLYKKVCSLGEAIAAAIDIAFRYTQAAAAAPLPLEPRGYMGEDLGFEGGAGMAARYQND